MTAMSTATRARRESSSARSVTAVLIRGISWSTPLVIMAAVWELLSRIDLVDRSVLPPFTEVIQQSIDMITLGDITPHITASLYRALTGLAIGASIGVVIGISMAMMPLVRQAVYPLVTLTYALPKSALIPIALLWLGVGDRSIILCVVFGAAVPLIINAFHGAESVPERQIWSAQSMGASRARIFFSVVLPSASPQILTGLRMALPLSFILVISAEMVASFVGIGNFIYAFGGAGNYASMFGAILIVMTVAFAFDQALKSISSRLLRWSESESSHA